MPYPHKHLYLTAHWFPGDYPAESGQFGVRFAVSTNPTLALVTALKASFEQFWLLAANKISSGYQMKFLRLASIGPDGNYAPGTNSFDYVWAAPFGGGGGNDVNSLQTACASTLLTSVPHGQASKGRVYLPPINSSPAGAGDHLWTAADVNARSAGVAGLLTSCAGLLGAPAAVMSQGTVRATAGTARAVTGVATGRRPDVQRRRAKSVPDPRGTTSAVTYSGGDPGPVVDGWL